MTPYFVILTVQTGNEMQTLTGVVTVAEDATRHAVFEHMCRQGGLNPKAVNVVFFCAEPNALGAGGAR